MKITLRQAKRYYAFAGGETDHTKGEWEEVRKDIQAICMSDTYKDAARIIDWWGCWNKTCTAELFARRVREVYCSEHESPTKATGIEAEVCEDIAKRQELGIKKYGTTVKDNPLTLKQWLEHAYQESLDMAIYLKRAIKEVE